MNNISETRTNSHNTAFETPLSTQPRHAGGSGEAACVNQRDNVSETTTNSQDVAFETPLSAQPTNARGSGEAACVNQRDNVSETTTDSQNVAFETWLSTQPRYATESGELDRHEVLRQAMANSRLTNPRSAGHELPATGRQSPGTAD